MAYLSVKLLCYGITCLWFCNKRFCNTKGAYLCQALYNGRSRSRVFSRSYYLCFWYLPQIKVTFLKTDSEELVWQRQGGPRVQVKKYGGLVPPCRGCLCVTPWQPPLWFLWPHAHPAKHVTCLCNSKTPLLKQLLWIKIWLHLRPLTVSNTKPGKVVCPKQISAVPKR